MSSPSIEATESNGVQVDVGEMQETDQQWVRCYVDLRSERNRTEPVMISYVPKEEDDEDEDVVLSLESEYLEVDVDVDIMNFSIEENSGISSEQEDAEDPVDETMPDLNNYNYWQNMSLSYWQSKASLGESESDSEYED